MSGTLYVVSTPIGNLEDITLRALRILKEADVIAAEDTRHSLKLLNHYGIKKPLISYWSEREKLRAEELVSKLKDGLSVALISDAGTPGISDPGYQLVKRAIEENMDVVSIPGPSALIAALSISGLPTDEFIFTGFLSPKKGERLRALKELSFQPRTVVLYEAPHRILEALLDIKEVFGAERKAAVVKEITKMHEEAIRGNIGEILQTLEEKTIAGEYVIILEGRPKGAQAGIEEALREVQALMKRGMGRKEAVKTVSEAYGIGKKELYARSLE